MPLFIGDYLSDTNHLSTMQHGAYLLLMFHYWQFGNLPDDDRQLAQITRLSLKRWRHNRPVLQRFFYDGWKHKRIEQEIQRMIQTSIRRAASGSKGGTIAMINRWRR